MQFKGKINSYKLIDDGVELTISVDADEDYFSKLSDVRLDIKPWREGRSRSANGYFYTLVDKLADALRVSKPFIHNQMLRKYGQLQRIDGKPVWVVLPETDEVAHKVDEDETLHVRPTDDVREGNDGKMYRTYLLLKGSHEMDSKEFSVLLDGIISDCKEQGIQTLSKTEIDAMKERWGVDL